MNEEQHCRGPGVSFQRHALYFSLINSNKGLTLSEKYSKIRSENEKRLYPLVMGTARLLLEIAGEHVELTN